MKKLALTLAILTLLASLSACTPPGAGEGPTDTEAHATEAPTEAATEAATEGSTQPSLDVYSGPFPSGRGYRTDFILKEGETGYFEGKMPEELYDALPVE